MNFELLSRGKKPYFTHSLRSFVKGYFYHWKIKSISSYGRVISSMHLTWGIVSKSNSLTEFYFRLYNSKTSDAPSLVLRQKCEFVEHFVQKPKVGK